MAETKTRRPIRRYKPEEIERGLAAVAVWGGNTRRAARQLKAAGLSIPRETLRGWIETVHSERYAELRTELVPRIHAKIAEESEDLARREAELAHKVLDRLETELPDIPARDLPGALRNLDTGKAINVEKSLLTRSQPTVIVGRQSPDELWRQLKRIAPQLFVEGTAEELPEAKEIEA